MSTKEIIRQIAKENGVTPAEVKREIKNAIRISMATKTVAGQAFWAELSPDGKEPTIDRFLKFCAGRITQNQNKI